MVGRDKVYWPNVTSAKIFKLLRERTDPDETRWQCYDCCLLGTAGRFCMQSCLVIYMCCSKNIKYLSTLKYFVQMIYKALDKSQDWLNYPAIINTDIDEQFIRKRKREPPTRFLEDNSDVDQVKDETFRGGHCLKKKIASSNVSDLPASSTLGDKPPLPTSLELQTAFRNGSSGSTSSLTLCSTPQHPFSYDMALRDANDIVKRHGHQPFSTEGAMLLNITYSNFYKN